MKENERVLSASLFRIGGMDGDGGSGGAALEDRLLPLKDVQGSVREIFKEADKEGAEALSVDPFVNVGPSTFNPDKWRDGERITYVRSPVTGNWYEHVFEWDAHPFVRWLEDPKRLSDPDFWPVGAGPFRPRGLSSSDVGKKVHAGVFYRVVEVIDGIEEEDEGKALGLTAMATVRALASENRRRVRKMLEQGAIERVGGLEGPLGEVLRRADSLGVHIARTEGALGYFGERIKTFFTSPPLFSTIPAGWGRYPHMPGYYRRKTDQGEEANKKS